jgi:hypothetical protein
MRQRAAGVRHALDVQWVALGLCLGLGSFGCVPAQPPTEAFKPVVVNAGVSPVALDPLEVSWRPGLHEYEFQVPGQGARSAEVWMPAAATPRALVIMLHGTVVTPPGVRPGHARLRPSRLLSCLAEPALHALDPIIIGPRSPDGQWWRESDTAFVLGLVRAVRQRWPEAGAKSVIAGYSNGGIGTWYFARLYPEYFSAAVPMAFSFDIVGASVLPIYAIQGTKDEQFPIKAVRSAILRLKAEGRDVTLNEKSRATHSEMCEYVPELTDAGRWLEQHVFAAARPAGL